MIDKYPLIRHFSSYESAVSILENNFILSRCELKRNLNSVSNEVIKNKKLDSKDRWWQERKELEINRFGTEDMIFCTPDWFNDSKYETGHGPVMFYFKPEIFEDYNITLTILDSLSASEKKVYDKNNISEIYSSIINENYNYEASKIIKNLESMNKEQLFETSRGEMFIEGNRFHNKYSELQIYSRRIPIEYIQEIRITDNYLFKQEYDDLNKNKLIKLCIKKGIKIKKA
jgi:hypothetical protein